MIKKSCKVEAGSKTCFAAMFFFYLRNANTNAANQIRPSQLKENIIQGWLWYVIRSSIQVGVFFSISLLILSGFPLNFFHLAEANLVSTAIFKSEKPFFHLLLPVKRCTGVKVELLTMCFFGALYSCVCSCPRSSRNVFNV